MEKITLSTTDMFAKMNLFRAERMQHLCEDILLKLQMYWIINREIRLDIKLQNNNRRIAEILQQ